MAAGWNAFPSIIIEKQNALGLDALDMNIILHLTQYWWQSENLPHPSVGKIAAAVGVKPRTIQKRMAALDKLGFVKREERRNTPFGSTTNLYSFKGLIEKVLPFAEEKIKEIEINKATKNKRLERKKPQLIVNNDK